MNDRTREGGVTNDTTRESPTEPFRPRWWVDRSRYERGLDYCPRARYLEYHAGPTGYGFRRRRGSIPLLLGTATHEALATLLAHVQATGQLPDESTIRAAIATPAAAYRDQVQRFGLAQIGEVDTFITERLIREQVALLTGQVWTWALHVLPWVHERARVVSVEQEETLVLDCGCGQPDGSVEQHRTEACGGIVIQGRADFITESRLTGTLAYEEFKTTSGFSPMWTSGWETKLQFAMGMLAAEQRLGAEIHEHYVHGLAKGRRLRDKDPITGEDLPTKYQASPFCYGYCRQGMPPLEPDDWKPEYQWTDEWGKFHRVSNKHKRRPVWEYGPVPDGIDPVEFWIRQLPVEVQRKQHLVLGPFNRQRVMIDSLARQIVGEEDRWQTILEDLFAVATELGPGYWTRPEFQARLDRLVPCSWACRRYGLDHNCQFEPICFRQAGWDDPFSNGFVLRRPHHEPELLQMRAQGLEPDEEGMLGGEEEGE